MRALGVEETHMRIEIALERIADALELIAGSKRGTVPSVPLIEGKCAAPGCAGNWLVGQGHSTTRRKFCGPICKAAAFHANSKK